MVETKTTVQPSSAKKEDPRARQREDRARRLKMIKGDRPETVKVFAASEDLQRVLRHPNGVRFRNDINEAVEWPNDSFTARRIADGSVSTEKGAGGQQTSPEDQEKMNPREIAAARKPKEKEEKQQAQPEGDGNKQKPTKPQPPPSAA